jgi:ADP-heptose:LPS heptosyltransferase
VNLVGKTSLDEVFSLIRGSVGILGHPSGITILSTAFRVPSLVIWNDYFNKDFWWNAMPPESYHQWYEAVNSSEVTVESLVTDFERVAECRLSQS